MGLVPSPENYFERSLISLHSPRPLHSDLHPTSSIPSFSSPTPPSRPFPRPFLRALPGISLCRLSLGISGTACPKAARAVPLCTCCAPIFELHGLLFSVHHSFSVTFSAPGLRLSVEECFMRLLLVFTHLLERVRSAACIHADDSRNASLSAL